MCWPGRHCAPPRSRDGYGAHPAAVLNAPIRSPQSTSSATTSKRRWRRSKHAIGRWAPQRGFILSTKTSPTGLVEHLQDTGYRQTEPTVTMFKRLSEAAAVPDVEIRDHAWDQWRQVYLAEITRDRRAVNTDILERIPAPSAFFGRLQEEQVVSTALCVVGFGCAVVECVTTRTQARRKGAARIVLSAVEHWALGQKADMLGLQVAQRNIFAMSLYHSLGFMTGATNRFWIASDTQS